MNIETLLSDLKDAITENTAVLREVLAVSGAPATLAEMKLELVKEKGELEKDMTNAKAIQARATKKPPAVEPEPVAVVEPEPVAVVEPEPAVEETPEPVTAAVEHLDPEALITQITDTWKAQLTAADPERKVMLKDKFPELRAKWGLAADAKLITLTPTPEKLAGLLADIKAL